MNLPFNGKELLDARKKGLKPRGVVLITDTKKKRADCQLVLTHGERYDFSMLRGLDVFVAFECDWFRWETSIYREWEDATLADIQRECKELYVFPSTLYWGQSCS